jgi:hypothetical protein
MSTLIVLFNLRSDADADAYENWAKTTDLPIVRGLSAVDSFEVYRNVSLFGSDEAAPYQYVEIIEINNLERFGEEVSADTMRKVAGEFQTFADNPTFMLSNKFS